MLKDRDSKQSIQVTIRVRPLSQKQLSQDSRICVRMEQSNSLHLSVGGEVKKFTFDSICFNQSQQQIFQRVGKKCTVDCLEGYNCTIFAYGQTGAGKTYTMMGVNFEHENYYENRGLIPRTMQFLFECIDRERENGVNFIIRCSFLEIYNEQIIDLLNKSNTNLQLREDTRKGVYVEGITEELITKSEEAMDILYKGSKSRHVGSTFYNETSSRSHSVFTMQIESKYTKNGVSNTKSRQFNFIDLAGSERTKQSTGERLKEGCNINKSLMNLASVINALSQVSEGKMQHVNYRNSKLTFLLKDSLGGNSKTNLIANISPATVFFQQTLSTLGFARRAKLIKREKASINEDSSGNLQSMKNEIKRLKQEVISLMSRVQAPSNPSDPIQQEKPSEMTAIMHQYVEEEIDKQTRLQLEILKLNDRIVHLQNGIKQYSNNEIHLRMIISVYEDKISRLKNIEKTLNQNLGSLNENDQESKLVITYFRNQRNNFIKQLENIKAQSDNNKFLKELLKQARIMKEDGEDESLKQLLIKNTNFLNTIRSKLDQMKPEKIEFEINSEFEKKITLMQQDFQKKEEEYQERMDQLNLDLADFKNRNQENEKLLEEAISGQIVLEEKMKQEHLMTEKLNKQVEAYKTKVKQVEVQSQAIKTKFEETIQELRNEICEKDTQTSIAKKEVQNLKSKLQKASLHENALKAEFENLQQQKYKLDKQLLQSIEQLRDSKNSLLKTESEVTLLHRKIEAMISQSNDLKHEFAKLQENILQKENSFKIALEQAEKKHQVEMQGKITQSLTLKNEIKTQHDQIAQINERFVKETEHLSSKIIQLKEQEEQYKSIIANQQEKIREMLSLVNEKELNGTETTIELNQVKIDLINAHSQMQTLEAKYKKIVEELKEKLQKESANCEQIEIQLNEKTKLYNSLNVDYLQKKKECAELAENLSKMTAKANNLEHQVSQKQESIDEFASELELLKNKQKEQKLTIMEMKNELFVSQKNSQIEAGALKSQVSLKDQQIEQLQRQLAKNKQKYEKQVEELKKEIDNLTQTYKSQEESLNKTMESHLSAKQKKLSEMKQVLHEKQISIKKLSQSNSELTTINQSLSDSKAQLQQKLNLLTKNLKELEESNQQLKQQFEDSKERNEKQIEQMEIIHNEQIDQKNEQIQAFMIENESLNARIQQIKAEVQNFKKTNASLLAQISVKNQNYKALSEQNISIQAQLSAARRQFDDCIMQKQKQISQTKIQLQNQLKEAQSKLQQTGTICANEQKEKEEMIDNMKSCQVQIQKLRNESSDYVNTISLLTQENYGLNQQLKDYFHSKKEIQEKIISLQASQMKAKTEGEAEKSRLLEANVSLRCQLQALQNIDLENKQKLFKLNELTNQLTQSLESERFAASRLMQTNSSLKESLEELNAKLIKSESEIAQGKSEMEEIKGRQASLTQNIKESNSRYEKLSQNHEKLTSKYAQLNEKCILIESQLVKSNEETKNLNAAYEESKEKQGKEINVLKTQNTFLIEENRKQASEIINLSKVITEIKQENSLAKERINKFELHHQKLNNELEELHLVKQKWELQANEMDKLRSQIEDEKCSKERIFSELCREKESNSNLKMLIENKSAQYMQLELQLEEKDSIYKKLVEKIAKNESENKKTTNSQHYLKTIQLLEKSRAEQIELRRQNEQLKKVMMSMKETIEEKEAKVREMEQKSEGYCLSMHKRMEEIQNDYVELERTHEKLVKERKHYSHDNEQLKQEIKNLKTNVAKLMQKNEEMESKIKKANLDYLQLQKEYEDIKKNEFVLPNNNDEKIQYINKMKADIAILKTELTIMKENLTKEREEKTKLKAEMRFGKDGNAQMAMKLELEKKLNENKNLTEFIFEIISQLKICVNEPKTKLEVIRTTILGAIKEKNNEIKALKEKVRDYEADQHRPLPVSKGEYPVVHRENRELKALSITNSNRPGQESGYRFEKDKDPSFLNNSSRQKMKEFEKYYAKFKSNDGESKPRNA